MSDKKSSAGGESFDREFEKFLAEETARVGALYRKLPQAEPDAQLDARVRARAREGFRDEPSFVSAQRTDPVSRSRRWLPAFASAAVLVLAAGVAWRLGPQNWAQKDVAKSVAVDATTASNANAPATGAAALSVPTTTQHAPAASAPSEAAATKASGSVQPNADDGANAPAPFPPAKPAPRIAPPTVSGGALASAQAELGKAESARHADAATTAPGGPESSAQTLEKNAREKSALANLDYAHTELKKAPVATQPATAADAPAAPPWTLAARTVSSSLLPNKAAPNAVAPAASPIAAESTAAVPSPPIVAKPAPMEAEQRAQDAVKAKSLMSPPAVPPPPPIAAPEAATAQTPTASVPEQAPVDARRRDEPSTERQRATEIADRSTLVGATARSAAAPPPVAPSPSAMQALAPATGFAPEPSAATTASKPKPPASAADEETQKQSYADHFALPAGSPPAKIPGRPTAAQLAAWPAPNCRVAGAVTASGPNITTRTWNYPPDVPDSAHLRFAIVQEYLDVDSREGALKAYMDFRHCYPDDRWPESLLQRLGTQ